MGTAFRPWRGELHCVLKIRDSSRMRILKGLEERLLLGLLSGFGDWKEKYSLLIELDGRIQNR